MTPYKVKPFTLFILAFIFPPVGIYYLIKNINNNLAANILVFIGFGFGFFAIFGLLGHGDEPMEFSYFFIALIFFVTGLIFIFCGHNSKKSYERFKNYKNILFLQNFRYFPDIIKMSGYKKETVVRDFQKYISNNQINGYIDYNKQLLVLIQDKNIANSTINISQPETKALLSICKCVNCGANNKIIQGESSYCEYCGSGLTQPRS